MMIDGREYITPEQYAATYGRDASGLRAAARAGRAGLDEAAVRVNASTVLYPADLVATWRSQVDTYGRGVKYASAITRIARRYDLDRSLVWRAARAGRIAGAVQEPGGTWRIDDTAAAAWAAEWLGITEPVYHDDEDGDDEAWEQAA